MAAAVARLDRGAVERRGEASAGQANGAAAALAALAIQERHHTARLVICALAAVAAIGCLIPIANARPRYRPPG